jgi:hypothetical protein
MERQKGKRQKGKRHKGIKAKAKRKVELYLLWGFRLTACSLRLVACSFFTFAVSRLPFDVLPIDKLPRRRLEQLLKTLPEVGRCFKTYGIGGFCYAVSCP